MSSPKPHPERPTWFQDVKTGCEKQTDFFLKIRKLQKELINREQHNLVNAMERLKQLQYPRRKPVVRNFALPPVSFSSAFPKRPLCASRRETKQLQKQRADGGLIKPLKGKHLLPDRSLNVEEKIDSFSFEDIRRIYSRMLPVLNDNQIAKIVNEVRSSFPSEPSIYLLQPHLPSIPNVKRKANVRLENRLKLLTLAEESEYITTVPKIATPLLRQRKTESALTDTDSKPKKTESNRGKRSILNFDVDPNDSSVFTHCTCKCTYKHTDADDFINDGDDDGAGKDDRDGPLPSPNSRPGSHLSNKKPSVDNESNVIETPSVSLGDGQIEEVGETNEKPLLIEPSPAVLQDEEIAANSTKPLHPQTVGEASDSDGPLPPPNSRPGSNMSNKKPSVDNESNVIDTSSVSLGDGQTEEAGETNEKPLLIEHSPVILQDEEVAANSPKPLQPQTVGEASLEPQVTN